MQEKESLETEPHVMSMDELGVLLAEQEVIGNTLDSRINEVEMDKFILDQVLGAQGSSMEVKVEVKTAKQSNQVCLDLFSFFI